MKDALNSLYKNGKQPAIGTPKIYTILPENIKNFLLLFTILIIASIPPLFVVLDRWFNTPILLRIESGDMCNANFLCRLGMPDYFYVIFGCTFILLGIFIYIRKDAAFETLFNKPSTQLFVTEKPYSVPSSQILISKWIIILSASGVLFTIFYSLFTKTGPGWDLVVVILAYLLAKLLAEYDLIQFWKYIYRNHKWLIAIILSHLSLVLLLKDLYSINGFQWLWGLVFVFATMNLIRFRKFVKPIYWIISLALILFSFNLNDRLYTFVGDELSFFFAGRYISTAQSLFTIGENLFHGTYVYEAHPYFSSLIQAFFMKLLGVDSFGWRFSNFYLSATSIGLFYLFFKRLCSKRIALFTSILLAGSEYLMSFGKIGYNNLQALFVMGLVLAVSAYAVQSKRLFGFTLLGATMALCFYVFPAALYILPIPILFLFFYLPPFSKQNIRFWLLMILPLFVCILPLLVQGEYWQSKLTGTVFNTPGLVEAPQDLLIHFVSNIIFAFYSFLYTNNPSHYVFSSYVDPLTGLFVLIGVSVLLGNFFRQKFVTFWMSSFAFMVFLVGASHDQMVPLVTRMFLLLPFFAFFAAIGLSWFQVKLKQVFTKKKYPKISIRILLFTIILLNIYQAYVKSPEFYVDNFEASYLRTIENIEKKFTDDPKTFFVVTSKELGINAIQALQAVYGIPKDWDRIIGLDASQIIGSDTTKVLFQQGTTFVIVRPLNDTSLQKTLNEQLSALGKKHCPITDRPGGNPLFELWYPDGFDSVCL